NAAGTGGDTDPVWTPDGRQIVYTSARNVEGGDGMQMRQEVWVVGADGGDPHRLIEDASQLRFSPDGSRMAFVQGGVLHTAARDGSDDRTLTPSGLQAQDYGWSPDGAQLYVHVTTSPGFDPGQLVSIPARGGAEQTVAVGDLFYPQFSPDGRYVAFQAPNLTSYVFDLVTGTGRVVAPSGVMFERWRDDRPATMRLMAYGYTPTSETIHHYDLDVSVPGAEHVRLTDGAPDGAEQPAPGSARPFSGLPPIVVADAEFGPPFAGGPAPEDAWAASTRTAAPAPRADARSLLRFAAAAPAGLAAVRVSLGRRLRHGRCRFLGADGRLGRGDACGATHLVPTGGASRW